MGTPAHIDWKGIQRNLPEGQNILVLVHAKCMDGLGAAWSAMRWIDNVEIISLEHGSTPPDVTGRHVLMFDFAYPREKLITMHEQAATMVVVDHHDSAKKDLEGLDFAVFDMTKSGAVLAWEYLAAAFGEPGVDDKVPEVLQYIQDRDIWKWELEGSQAYSAALRSKVDFEVLSYRDCIAALDHVFHYVDRVQMIAIGEPILKLKDEIIIQCMNRRMWLRLKDKDGIEHDIPATFAPASESSQVGNNLAALENNPSRTGLVITGFAYGKFGLGFRGIGDDNDLPQRLAIAYGGGGHKLAAGAGILPEQFAELIAHAIRPEHDIPADDASKGRL